MKFSEKFKKSPTLISLLVAIASGSMANLLLRMPPGDSFIVGILGFIAVEVAIVAEQQKAEASRFIFHEAIEFTHAISMFKATDSSYFRATYLNPRAFEGGQPIARLEKYWSAVEKLDIPRYRRIFGVLPDELKYADTRRQTIEWLRGHWERTRHLADYSPTYLEVEEHMFDFAIFDNGLLCAFPYAKQNERGFSSTDKRMVEAAMGYFDNLLEQSNPLPELWAEDGTGDETQDDD